MFIFRRLRSKLQYGVPKGLVPLAGFSRTESLSGVLRGRALKRVSPSRKPPVPAAAGIKGRVHVVREKVVGDEVNGHACLRCGEGIFPDIVAHHEAIGGIEAESVQDIGIIQGIGLAEGAVFIGSDPIEIRRFQADP